MEKDEFTAWFDQEFLGSKEGSHVGFMKCHVQKRSQSDFYVNCKPVHRSKCVLVNNFEISKECLPKNNRNSFPTVQQKCSKLMNDSCFKAQKEFDKAKQGFVKSPYNMCSQIIFMNIEKQYKITLCLSEKACKEYWWNLYKIADIGDQQQIHMQFWTAVKSLPWDCLGNKSNCDHPDIWELYFQKPLSWCIDNSQTFQTMRNCWQLSGLLFPLNLILLFSVSVIQIKS